VGSGTPRYEDGYSFSWSRHVSLGGDYLVLPGPTSRERVTGVGPRSGDAYRVDLWKQAPGACPNRDLRGDWSGVVYPGAEGISMGTYFRSVTDAPMLSWCLCKDLGASSREETGI